MWLNPWSGEKVELIDLRVGTANRDDADQRQAKLATVARRGDRENVAGTNELRWPRVLTSNVDKSTKGVPPASYVPDPAVTASRVASTGGGPSVVAKWSLPLGITAAAAALGAVGRRQLTLEPIEILQNDREPPIT